MTKNLLDNIEKIIVQRRIDAHIYISFAANKVYEEPEKQLVIKESDLSPKKQ